MRILVTGASGFIGSAFVRRAWERHQLVALVRDTNQRNLRRLHELPVTMGGSHFHPEFENVAIVKGDLLGDISGICERVDAVVHFAARTFVDHAIRDPGPFVEANVVGTYRLLEDARRNRVKRFIHISTDEVYGAILDGAYTEDSRLNPTNPYAATKAGADCLTLAYAHTFGMHTTVTRTENNYGPYQHPQKVFPTFVRTALAGEPLPVYGDGGHVRQWLWVDDHIDALLLLLEADIPTGEVFHVAGSQELSNLELANRVLKVLRDLKVLPHQGDDAWQPIRFIDDQDIRPGHDRRYALKCDKLRALGWEPEVGLDEGIERAVRWYAENEWWLR